VEVTTERVFVNCISAQKTLENAGLILTDELRCIQLQWRAAMKRFLVTSLLLFAFSVNVLARQTAADDPATKEDVERYLQAIHSHDMMKQMMEAMIKPMHQMVHDQFVKDKDKLPADFEERMTKVIDDMMKDMPFDDMMQAMVPVYQKHFTKGDINAVIAFYSSPTGQKMLREMPAIMGESMQTIMPLMRKYTETMTARIQQEVAESLKKAGPNPSPTRN
jgi:hypothetical protein